jgi:hypothetical protein
MKKSLIKRLDTLIRNNNIIINAIENDKKINTEKAIKALAKSNNEAASIVKEYIENHNIVDKVDFDYLSKIIGKK